MGLRKQHDLVLRVIVHVPYQKFVAMKWARSPLQDSPAITKPPRHGGNVLLGIAFRPFDADEFLLAVSVNI